MRYRLLATLNQIRSQMSLEI